MSISMVVRTPGGPDALQAEHLPVGAPAAGEVRIRQTAIGVNFLDAYFRSGLYPAPLPLVPGTAAAGVVQAVGEGVDDFAVGDRVCYGNLTLGAYCEERVVKAASLVHVPPGVDDAQIAGSFVRGLTVWFLLRALHALRPGETVLFHAAAGGVGLLFCQWAKHIGATVIGTVGSEAKAAEARAAGCDHTVLYRSEDWVARVREVTGGLGVSVVYDGVGRDTFTGSLDCLATRGLMVTFGAASGPISPVDSAALSSRGSLFLTRPRLMDYIRDRSELLAASDAYFGLVAAGVLAPRVGQTFALTDAAAAHVAMEGRSTSGSTVLVT